MFKQMLKSYAENKMGPAIANYDLNALQHCLNRGARQIDYMLMQKADFGNGSTKIPAGKFTDPIKLAEHVGFHDGVKLMQQHFQHTPTGLQR